MANKQQTLAHVTDRKAVAERRLNILIGYNKRSFRLFQFISPALPPGPANSPILALIYEPLFLCLQNSMGSAEIVLVPK